GAHLGHELDQSLHVVARLAGQGERREQGEGGRRLHGLSSDAPSTLMAHERPVKIDRAALDILRARVRVIGDGAPLMADEPLTLGTLTRSHREMIAPDFQRVPRQLDRLDSRIEEVHTKVDGLAGRFEPLETDYRLLADAVREIEGRLLGLEGRIDQLAVRA